MSEINPGILKWFDQRGISLGNLEAMGVCSGRHQRIGDGQFEVIPDPKGNTIIFPFYRDGQIVMEKYRGSEKRFYQRPGGIQVFYNRDVLKDPALTEGKASLLIVEGEIDLLSVLESGYPFVVSVPGGAPPDKDPMVPDEDLNPLEDDKFSFVLEAWEDLKKVKRITLAGDDDGPGKRLNEELVRRLGRARCSFVQYPEGCKDFNDVLKTHGMGAVTKVIEEAKPFPVSGVYTFHSLPQEPPLDPKTTGFRALDGHLLPFFPALFIITGFAGSGKSTWANQLVAQLAILHGWKAAIASFEMRISPFVTNTLMQVYHDLYPGKDQFAQDWLDRNFAFIAPEPSDENDQFDIDWLIERAVTSVVRYGIRVLLVDPWNEIEHAVRGRESTTDYIGRAIRALKRFGREYGVLVIIVAHPNKHAANNKDPHEVSLYDIADTAHFANKADFGVVIARQGDPAFDTVSDVHIRKIRYQPVSGRPGTVSMVLDQKRGIFT